MEIVIFDSKLLVLFDPKLQGKTEAICGLLIKDSLISLNSEELRELSILYDISPETYEISSFPENYRINIYKKKYIDLGIWVFKKQNILMFIQKGLSQFKTGKYSYSANPYIKDPCIEKTENKIKRIRNIPVKRRLSE